MISQYISKTLNQTYGIRTLRSELDTVLVSLKLLRILSTCSASITFSSFAPPSSGGKNTAAGVNGYLGAAFRPDNKINSFISNFDTLNKDKHKRSPN